jgi:2-polyprenyl-6-methoxyphenol hydroxylase-like FAD-dependent oxidoreductase
MSPAVLIAGAGPSGLSLAITLRRFGVPVRIIDRAPQPSAVSKALAVWSGSLEALQGMQVIDEFLASGKRLRALSVGDGSRELAELAVGDGIDSPYPYPLLLPQSRTEQILTARLSALDVEIERCVELIGLAQDADGVTATLRHADDRTESVRAPYLVGCDGARSLVRQSLGIAFEGYTEPETFLLGDVHIDGGRLDHRSIYLWWHNGGTVALFPFEDELWRVFAMRGTNGSDAAPTVEELQRRIELHGPPGLRLRDPAWLSAFRINERLAARYRAGRCFLVGDAAHIHSPAGGQGMNTGIQDATNLGWKLAYALNGIGDEGLLLDSYEAERRPVARAVIDAAAQKQHLAFGSSTIGRIIKDIAITILGNMSAVQKKLQVELSETEVVYRGGPLVELAGAPRRARRTEVGARARDAMLVDPATGQPVPLWPRLSELRHTLLLFDDAQHAIAGTGMAEGTADRLQILAIDAKTDPKREVHDRYHVRGPGWVLIRPDQVVAARGEGADLTALNRYLGHVVRSGGAARRAEQSRASQSSWASAKRAAAL